MINMMARWFWNSGIDACDVGFASRGDGCDLVNKVVRMNIPMQKLSHVDVLSIGDMISFRSGLYMFSGNTSVVNLDHIILLAVSMIYMTQTPPP